MPETTIILILIALPGLICASAFFSGTETALFSLNPNQHRRLTKLNKLFATSTITLLSQSSHTLITILLSNMITNVSYFVLSTILLIKIKHTYTSSPLIITILTILPLVLIILLGEVLPKLIASKYPSTWCKYAAFPLLIIDKIITPLRLTISKLIITPLTRLFTPSNLPEQLHATELQTLISISQQQGVLDRSEQQLLSQVLLLSRLKVKAVMTPRVDIHAYDIEEPLDKLYQTITQHRPSRIPIYKENLDNIQGIILTKQFLLKKPTSIKQLKPLIRQPYYTPELQKSDALLTHFRKTGITLAIAVDEYGGTAGLITLEDIVEQLVGEIAGPHEKPPTEDLQKISESTYFITADLPIQEWTQHFKTKNKWPDIATMGGLVMAQLGKIPSVGDNIKINDIKITVTKVQGNRATQLKLQLNSQKAK